MRWHTQEKMRQKWRMYGALLVVVLMILMVSRCVIVADEWHEQEMWPLAEEWHLDELRPRVDSWDGQVMVSVTLKDGRTIERVILQDYLVGVLAAEMPMNFHIEALKAQAIAARTYVIAHGLASGSLADLQHVAASKAVAEPQQSAKPKPDAAITIDIRGTTEHQAYLSLAERQAAWGTTSAAREARLHAIIQATADYIILYEEEPIEAVYFSTSHGWTESSEDVWSRRLSYLQPVPSPWERELSPRFRQVTEWSIAEVATRLGLSTQAVQQLGDSGRWWNTAETTTGGRLKQVTIQGERWSGQELRDKLALPSAYLEEIEMSEQGWRLVTLGYGHGVGMSQWGAQGMALQGYGAGVILQYYYQGVELAEISDWWRAAN